MCKFKAMCKALALPYEGPVSVRLTTFVSRKQAQIVGRSTNTSDDTWHLAQAHFHWWLSCSHSDTNNQNSEFRLECSKLTILDDAGGVTRPMVPSTILRANNTPSNCISVVVLVFRVSACVWFCEPHRLDTFLQTQMWIRILHRNFWQITNIYKHAVHVNSKYLTDSKPDLTKALASGNPDALLVIGQVTWAKNTWLLTQFCWRNNLWRPSTDDDDCFYYYKK